MNIEIGNEIIAAFILCGYIALFLCLNEYLYFLLKEACLSYKEKSYRWFLTFCILSLHTAIFIMYFL